MRPQLLLGFDRCQAHERVEVFTTSIEHAVEHEPCDRPLFPVTLWPELAFDRECGRLGLPPVCEGTPKS
jgi:hypothetical protein